MTVLGKSPDSSLVRRRELRRVRYCEYEGRRKRIDSGIDLYDLLVVAGERLDTMIR